MGAVAWYALCLLVSIALDWALIERFSTIFEVIIRKNAALSYRDGLSPRIFFTIVGAVCFAYGSFQLNPPNTLFFIGVFLFLLSVTWGIFVTFSGNET